MTSEDIFEREEGRLAGENALALFVIEVAHDAVEEVAALFQRPSFGLNDGLFHEGPDLVASLLHGPAGSRPLVEGHQPGQEVDGPAVVHLPEDL